MKKKNKGGRGIENGDLGSGEMVTVVVARGQSWRFVPMAAKGGVANPRLALNHFFHKKPHKFRVYFL